MESAKSRIHLKYSKKLKNRKNWNFKIPKIEFYQMHSCSGKTKWKWGKRKDHTASRCTLIQFCIRPNPFFHRAVQLSNNDHFVMRQSGSTSQATEIARGINHFTNVCNAHCVSWMQNRCNPDLKTMSFLSILIKIGFFCSKHVTKRLVFTWSGLYFSIFLDLV